MVSLIDLPLVGNFINILDYDTKTHSFVRAMKHVVHRSRTKLVIRGLEKNHETILASEPVVVVANHPNEAEVLALIASLPERNDIYLIVNARMMGISQHLDNHFIPVYIDHHFNPQQHNAFLSFVFKKFHSKEVLSAQQEHKLNIISIKKAADIVNKGGLVIIFPGRRSIDGHWFSGIGHVVRQINNRNNAYIFQVFSQGTSRLDYFRLIPYIGYFLPKIIINYASPLSMRKVWHRDPKEIATNMEMIYTKWIKRFIRSS